MRVVAVRTRWSLVAWNPLPSIPPPSRPPDGRWHITHAARGYTSPMPLTVRDLREVCRCAQGDGSTLHLGRQLVGYGVDAVTLVHLQAIEPIQKLHKRQL